MRVLVCGELVLRDAGGMMLPHSAAAGEVLLFSAVGAEAAGTTATVMGWY
ncbi:hypothetical protein [Pseudophaeobacter sp.]